MQSKKQPEKDERILNLFDSFEIHYILKTGTESVGQRHCLFHQEKTPSLFIYSDFVYCFGCGAGYILDDLPDEIITDIPLPSQFRESARGVRSRIKTPRQLHPEQSNLEFLLVDLKLADSVAQAQQAVYESFRRPWRGGKLTAHTRKEYLALPQEQIGLSFRR